MPVTFNEKLIAYLALLCGLSISAVAVYYSVIGLTAIFSAAVIPIIIMGTILEIGKLVATIWLKQNWKIAPTSIKVYLISAILVLMLITSLGIFGFLSKAHLDQTVPTGNVVNQIALIDEKIRIERENIDVARKAIRQLDDAVDQTLARSTTEQGAARAAQLRRNQTKERSQLQADITKAQETIKQLNEDKIPISGQLRKVEAEVGPIKYIANFFYGETDQSLLEKSVTWVIITLIIVFDPLAVILLLASQVSFQNFYERRQPQKLQTGKQSQNGLSLTETTTTTRLDEVKPSEKKTWVETEFVSRSFQNNKPVKTLGEFIASEMKLSDKEVTTQTSYVQNEEQNISNRWNSISQEDYLRAVKDKQNSKE